MSSQQLQLAATQQRLTAGDQNVVLEMDLAFGPAAAEGNPGGLTGDLAAGKRRLVSVDDGDVRVRLVGKDPQLRVEVGVEIAVAVEMVRRQVQENSAVGRELDRILELESSTPRRSRSCPR